MDADADHFTDNQIEWFSLINHIAASLSIEPEKPSLSLFNRKGGLGRFYDIFWDRYEEILTKMNEVLIA